jgi:hypothetical protein
MSAKLRAQLHCAASTVGAIARESALSVSVAPCRY